MIETVTKTDRQRFEEEMTVTGDIRGLVGQMSLNELEAFLRLCGSYRQGGLDRAPLPSDLKTFLRVRLRREAELDQFGK